MMHKITKIALAFCLFLALSTAASAQEYKSAIGLRLGAPVSVSYKTFISEPGAIEVFAGFRNYNYYGWFNAGGAYQHHNEIASVEGLKWYYGAGASVYIWHYDDGFLDAGANTSFGILGTLGLDYKLANAPVNFSADWMPIWFVNGYGSGFGAGYGALSVRYVLN